MILYSIYVSFQYFYFDRGLFSVIGEWIRLNANHKCHRFPSCCTWNLQQSMVINQRTGQLNTLVLKHYKHTKYIWHYYFLLCLSGIREFRKGSSPSVCPSLCILPWCLNGFSSYWVPSSGTMGFGYLYLREEWIDFIHIWQRNQVPCWRM